MGRLTLAHAVLGCWRDAARGLAHGNQEVQRDAGPRAHLLERFAGERAEEAVGGVVHEREGEATASQHFRQEVDRDAGSHQTLHDAHAPDISFTKTTRRIRLEDPVLDQLAQLIRADAGPIGRLGQFVGLHVLYCSGGTSHVGSSGLVSFATELPSNLFRDPGRQRRQGGGTDVRSTSVPTPCPLSRSRWSRL